jgi:hypothetical protein
VEEGLLAVDHAGKHAPETPHVEGVVVVLQVDEKLGTLKVARRHADVVLLIGVVKLGETPVDKPEEASKKKKEMKGTVIRAGPTHLE